MGLFRRPLRRRAEPELYCEPLAGRRRRLLSARRNARGVHGAQRDDPGLPARSGLGHHTEPRTSSGRPRRCTLLELLENCRTSPSALLSYRPGPDAPWLDAAAPSARSLAPFRATSCVGPPASAYAAFPRTIALTASADLEPVLPNAGTVRRTRRNHVPSASTYRHRRPAHASPARRGAEVPRAPSHHPPRASTRVCSTHESRHRVEFLQGERLYRAIPTRAPPKVSCVRSMRRARSCWPVARSALHSC